MVRNTTESIRQKFLEFFNQNGHTIVPASSLIPHNDPTLMFVNSGMVQFKDIFTGNDKRPYVRAATAQKSVRAGGKHNDLDNVGYTARHHTFFEMMGNFSFGDYFKEQAIFYAWNLITKEFGLQKEKLYATVYHTDDEAASYWKKIAGLSEDRIIRIKTNDNFWSMGDTGPCGPCSEIFYDHGEHIPGGLPGTPDEDGDRFIEIWNMVFMQFEQIDKDTRIELPQKSIDTGMGLERVAAVMQSVHNNYDIDIFTDLITAAEEVLKVKANGEAKFSYRVIADHLRSCSFLIGDGVMPSNEGRGYVLRRIMRRAMRHAHILGAREPVMYKLLPKLVDLMGSAYPELKRAQDFISSILDQEEIRFRTTLDRGLKLLEEETSNMSSGASLSGDVAFKLYDTYGFPLDLTEDILRARNIIVEKKSFEDCMQEQKDRARKSWSGSGESKSDTIWFDIKAEFGPTEFLGYLLTSLDGKVISLVQEGKRIDEISTFERFTLITNQTPFYGESGGQMGDIGIIESPTCRIKVIDTQKYLGGIHAHICVLESGNLAVGDTVKLTIDNTHRLNMRAHHSATHVLHAVLRETIGKHITQKGSLVAHDHLRFDFSHSSALSKAELDLIEDKVNQIIIQNSQVQTSLMSTEDAVNAGAMALFGEKYDYEVRVVSLGTVNENGISYSFELCGGTHVARTGDIGAFKIISESAIAAGVRRIEAVCGEFANKIARENQNLISHISDILKGTKPELIDKINSLVLSKKENEKEIEKLRIESLDLTKDQITANAIQINDCKLIYKIFHGYDPKVIRLSAEVISKKLDDLIVIYIVNNDGKLSITVAVSKAISAKYNAGTLVKDISIILGGNGGGGQATLAQAGGSDSSKLAGLAEKIQSLLHG